MLRRSAWHYLNKPEDRSENITCVFGSIAVDPRHIVGECWTVKLCPVKVVEADSVLLVMLRYVATS